MWSPVVVGDLKSLFPDARFKWLQHKVNEGVLLENSIFTGKFNSRRCDTPVGWIVEDAKRTDHADEGSTVFQNVWNCSPKDTASHSRRPESSATLSWKSHISCSTEKWLGTAFQNTNHSDMYIKQMCFHCFLYATLFCNVLKLGIWKLKKWNGLENIP